MSDIRALSLRLSGVNVPADHSKNKKPQAFYYTVQPCTRNRSSDFSTSASFPDAGRRKRKGSAMRLVDFRSRGPLQKTNSVVICISTEKPPRGRPGSPKIVERRQCKRRQRKFSVLQHCGCRCRVFTSSVVPCLSVIALEQSETGLGQFCESCGGVSSRLQIVVGRPEL
eukprot:2283163-Rhodomonas_salina.1